MASNTRLSIRSLSQPDPVVPMKLKIAIEASRLAAVTSAIPLSMQAGMRWVPMSPLVEAPQMK